MPTINEAAVLRFYVDTQEYSDRLTAIEAQASSSLTTQQTEVAAAIAQVNLTQSQAITALTLEVSNLKTNLTDSITATQTDLINRADQLAQEVTDTTVQLTQEIQDALDSLQEGAAALRTPRKIQGVDFDGTKDISLPTFTAQTDGLVPKRIGATADNYLREDGTWVVPTDTTYALLTQDSAEDGTATSANSISAKVLKEAIQYHAPTVTNIAGNAATTTKLQTPRSIAISGAVTGTAASFDGSANIAIATTAINGSQISTGTIPAERIPTLNQNTTGNASTASKLGTARSVTFSGGATGSYNFDGSTDVVCELTVAPPVVSSIDASVITTGTLNAARIPTLNQNTSGNAATATKLATARNINGVVFDGTTDIQIPSETSNATETVAGKAKIATTAVAQAGVNDTDFITALKLKNTLDAKAGFAQINANGTINRSKGIIQSCTKTATGTYAVNILNPLNKGVFALTAPNGANFVVIVSYVSSTSLQITTQIVPTAGLADRAFTIGVELQ